ncbi:MAG: hypothetical protein GF320_15610 [Armatimonadia bacterium]|nr:hypothetical protein [Armatimonadia bacterium]
MRCLILGAIVLAAAPWSVHAQPGPAPVDQLDPDQLQAAYDLACDAAGMELLPTPIPTGSGIVGFETPASIRPRETYEVHVGFGVFWGRRASILANPPPPSVAEVLQLARAEAARYLPRDVISALHWRITQWSGGTILARGAAPHEALPPVMPTIECRLVVIADARAVQSYTQMYYRWPRPEEEPAVDFAAALDALRERLGGEDVAVLVDPHGGQSCLWRIVDQLHWRVVFETTELHGAASIDARTGEVTDIHSHPGPMPRPPMEYSEAGADHPYCTGWYVVGADGACTPVTGRMGQAHWYGLSDQNELLPPGEPEAPRTPVPLTVAEGAELASKEARRQLPEAADDLTWEACSGQFGGLPELAVAGHGPRLGDPPRHGLSPRCRASIRHATGEVASYQQYVPPTTDPLPVSLTPEQAGAIALAREGEGAFVLDTGPTLWQSPGGLTWQVQVLTAGGGLNTHSVDDESAEVRMTIPGGGRQLLGGPGAATEAATWHFGDEEMDEIGPRPQPLLSLEETLDVASDFAGGPVRTAMGSPPTPDRWLVVADAETDPSARVYLVDRNKARVVGWERQTLAAADAAASTTSTEDALTKVRAAMAEHRDLPEGRYRWETAQRLSGRTIAVWAVPRDPPPAAGNEPAAVACYGVVESATGELLALVWEPRSMGV